MGALAVLGLAAALGTAVTLQNRSARVSFELGGGGLVDFQLAAQRLNPFSWDSGGGAEARARGHFLCLDRWGAPSEGEKAAGMPFHGEASRVTWKLEGSTPLEATMSAVLPLAHLAVRREARLHPKGAVLVVSETVTNQAALGRVYNLVQHATIGPPFLDVTTVVDANAAKGFMQSSPLPNPEEPAVTWPEALKDGRPVDLRRLVDDPAPNVVSYTIDEAQGWTTAATPKRGLLVGYLWRVAEYPWLNLWRHVDKGKPFARGLEFGTTGLHQPPPVLVEKGHIFGRPVFAFLDAGASATRRYTVFLVKVPADFRGAARVVEEGGRITVQERGSQRRFSTE